MIVLSNLFRRVMQYMIWGLPGFGSFDPKRSAQITDLCEIDVANVVGTVVGSNLSARPVKAFDPKFRAGLRVSTIGMSGCQRLCVFTSAA